ncbi:MAG: hypothetical protein HY549_03455 [Elusimicrobia bacterium]|nr:hypothetical protein [Elusimicrobiota bacterium]
MAARGGASNGRDRAALDLFAAIVRRCREASGYPAARAFYQAMGGAAFFGCTYKAYLNVENGVSLPQPRLVERLVAAFRLALHKDLARDFALAYLGLLFGSGEWLDLTARTLESQDTGPGFSRVVGSLEMTPKQRRVLSDPEALWCYAVLAQDRDRWSAGGLATFLDLPERAVEKALKSLINVQLICRGGGRYWSPHAGRLAPPMIDPASLVSRHAEALEKSRGYRMMEHPLLIRASETEFRPYFSYFSQSLDKARQHATISGGGDTALFLIEGVVTKLLDF